MNTINYWDGERSILNPKNKKIIHLFSEAFFAQVWIDCSAGFMSRTKFEQKIGTQKGNIKNINSKKYIYLIFYFKKRKNSWFLIDNRAYVML